MKQFTKEDFIKIGNRYLLKNSCGKYYNRNQYEKMISNEEKKVEKENGKSSKVDLVKKTTAIKK